MNEDSVEARDVISLQNVCDDKLSLDGNRLLALDYQGLAPGRVGRVETATFVPSFDVSSYFDKRGDRLLASPRLYPGQTIKSRVVAAADNASAVDAAVYIKHYDEEDKLCRVTGDEVTLAAGESAMLAWQVPDLGGWPIALAGVQIIGTNGSSGRVYLDMLTWDGAPNVALVRPYKRDLARLARGKGPKMWKKAWVNGMDTRERLTELDFWPETYRLIQNVGRGLFIHGSRDWTDYQVSARMTPHMCRAGGLGVRVQGMKRYYALLCDEEGVRLVAAQEGQDTLLAQAEGGWSLGRQTTLRLKVEGNRLSAYLDGELVLEAEDPEQRFSGGGIALIAEEGRIGCEDVEVRPL